MVNQGLTVAVGLTATRAWIWASRRSRSAARWCQHLNAATHRIEVPQRGSKPQQPNRASLAADRSSPRWIDARLPRIRAPRALEATDRRPRRGSETPSPDRCLAAADRDVAAPDVLPPATASTAAAPAASARPALAASPHATASNTPAEGARGGREGGR